MGTTASRISFGTTSPQASAASSAVASTSSMSSGEGWASIRQRRPNPMCQRSSLLDALHALEHPGQRAVLQVREQRALPGTGARSPRGSCGRGRCPRRRAARPAASSSAIAGSRSSKSSSTPAGACSRAASSRSSGVSPGSSSTSAAMRSNITAWRCSSRRCRYRTQATSGVVGRLAERRDVLGDGVLRHAEAGEQRGEARAALVRRARATRGRRERGRWPSRPTAAGPRAARRSWASGSTGAGGWLRPAPG